MKKQFREMKEASGWSKNSIKVIELIILKNFWEIYIIEQNGDELFTLTCGHETELGYSSLEELKPYIACRTKDLSTVMPAPNWEWVS